MLAFVPARRPASAKPRTQRQSANALVALLRVVVLAEQLLQAAEPAAALYCPTAHAAHGPPFGPVCPASHRHASGAVLAAALVEFDAQCAHAALPLAAFHSPARHATQGPPAGPEYPGAHTQSVCAALPAAATEALGHCCAGASPPAHQKLRAHSAQVPSASRAKPGSHAHNDVAFGPPALHPGSEHTHCAGLLAPTTLVAPAGHCSHALMFGEDEYEPLAHSAKPKLRFP